MMRPSTLDQADSVANREKQSLPDAFPLPCEWAPRALTKSILLRIEKLMKLVSMMTCRRAGSKQQSECVQHKQAGGSAGTRVCRLSSPGSSSIGGAGDARGAAAARNRLTLGAHLVRRPQLRVVAEEQRGRRLVTARG